MQVKREVAALGVGDGLQSVSDLMEAFLVETVPILGLCEQEDPNSILLERLFQKATAYFSQILKLAADNAELINAHHVDGDKLNFTQLANDFIKAYKDLKENVEKALADPTQNVNGSVLKEAEEQQATLCRIGRNIECGVRELQQKMLEAAREQKRQEEVEHKRLDEQQRLLQEKAKGLETPQPKIEGIRVSDIRKQEALQRESKIEWSLDLARKKAGELLVISQQLLSKETKPALPFADTILPALAALASNLVLKLPKLDEKSYEAPLPVKTSFTSFEKPGAKTSAMASAMALLEARIDQIISLHQPPAGAIVPPQAVVPPQNDPEQVRIAKHIRSALHTQTQLAGWKHVKEYIANPQGYLNALKQKPPVQWVPPVPPAPQGAPAPLHPIDKLIQEDGVGLLKRLMQRVEWVLSLQKTANQTFDVDFCLHIISADSEWMVDSDAFMKKAEKEVTDLLQKNPQRFAAFRDLQKRGVQWPHTAQIRKDIESAGFTFRPMMVKRDRCVCDICGVEIAGWRPWYNPWKKHHLARHVDDFIEKAVRFSAAFSQYDFPMATQANAAAAPPAASATAAAPPATSATVVASPAEAVPRSGPAPAHVPMSIPAVVPADVLTQPLSTANPTLLQPFAAVPAGVEAPAPTPTAAPGAKLKT